MVIGTPAVDGWAVTFGTARRNLGGPQLEQKSGREKPVQNQGPDSQKFLRFSSVFLKSCLSFS